MSYIFAMSLENRIRELRIMARLTQAELGARVGLHQTQIGNLEKGGRNLTFEWARRIAKAIDGNLNVADVLAENDNPDRLSQQEQNLVKNFRKAAQEQQALVQRVAEPLNGLTPAPTEFKLTAA